MFSRRTTYVIKISLAAVLFLLLTTASGCARTGPLTAKQKMEDFQYLFGVFQSSHPYLDLKMRTDQYDWLAHKSEFEEQVRAAETDADFARAIAGVLSQLNNGHTGIVPGELVRYYRDSARLAWMAQCRNTSPERADYWYDLSTGEDEAEDAYYAPFVAQYVCGKYLVFAMSPESGMELYVDVASEVISIDGVPVNQYVKNTRKTDFLMYDPDRKQLYAQYLVPPLVKGDIRVTFRTWGEGKMVDAKVTWTKNEWKAGYTYPPEYALKSSGCTDNVYTAVISDGKVGYVQVKHMAMDDTEDRGVLKGFFASVKDLPAIIIDIRGNPGGADSFWEDNLVGLLADREVTAKFACTWRVSGYLKPFVRSFEGSEVVSREAVRKKQPNTYRSIPPEIFTDRYVDPRMHTWKVTPRESVNYKGQVYLLVDGLVYSSAESFAAFCSASKWAMVCGYTTGGDGLAIDPAVVTLPNSGMVVRFPSVMGLNQDWSANEEWHTSAGSGFVVTPSGFRKYVLGQADGSLKEPNTDRDIPLKVCVMEALKPR